MAKRKDRNSDELREVVFVKDVMENAYSSVQVQFGKTKVLCTASVDQRVPPFIDENESGWLTAEYNMLPGSTLTRKSRSLYKPDSRSIEIQRLIARSLRAALDLKKIKGYSIVIDCDVIQADGGTRTASITGGYLALELAVNKMIKDNFITKNPISTRIASISAGKVKGNILLDLDYSEDRFADADFNIVMNNKGNFIEVQGTGEGSDITEEDLLSILKVCKKGINELFIKQEKAIVNEN